MVKVAHDDTAQRERAVFNSRAIKRQRDQLEQKKRTLLKSLAEVDENLAMVQDMKQNTRSGRLLRFGENRVFSISMEKDVVESRLMTPEAKRAIMQNVRQAALEEQEELTSTNAAVDVTDQPTSPSGSAPAPSSSGAAATKTSSSPKSKADTEAEELFDVQIRAIMMQHAEDCKRMHASEAGRLAKELMAQVRAVLPPSALAKVGA